MRGGLPHFCAATFFLFVSHKPVPCLLTVLSIYSNALSMSVQALFEFSVRSCCDCHIILACLGPTLKLPL